MLACQVKRGGLNLFLADNPSNLTFRKNNVKALLAGFNVVICSHENVREP